MSEPNKKFVIFAHGATYDKLHQVGTLALTAAALGRDVHVILMFWAIKKLAMGKLDEVDFPTEYSAYTEDVSRLLKEKRIPAITQMFSDARQVGTFRLIACSAGLEYMGVNHEKMTALVDEVLGLPAILRMTFDAETSLFI
ncbi:MAG TPA: hypothetical protein EYN18_09080 [Nitrospirales bacterium]|nr:hypothetical protein [Nitrospirales bacterium]HIC04043.1 hypothetical protein [Nitrospirales bacterium]HIO22525.1 hypothetical protein [Nitrospirales bacterium]HIO69660.1 hypothetical protein [Nitrospirales bacterium]